MTIKRAALGAAFAALAAACAAAASPAGAGTAGAAPRSFFGIVPQTPLSEEDTRFMRAGHIGTVRLGIGWEGVQPSRRGGYDWTGTDREIATAARQHLRVLPFLSGVPPWVKHRTTALPIDSARARRAWMAFVRAAVERYGPGGEFWAEHSPAVARDGLVIRRPLPIHVWQIWNEANFFYFAFPVSPLRYARLLAISHRAVQAVDPRAQIVLSGLFGEPDEGGRYGMPAARFLAALYRVPGIERYFDGVALHPYAFHVRDFRRMVERMRAVVLRNRDPGAALYITEMGWGSQYDPDVVSFEQGVHGQVRELRGAYRYMLRNRRRLNLRAAYWFSWKDARYYCNFCDSVGLFHESEQLRAKPAWHAFVRITGGRPHP